MSSLAQQDKGIAIDRRSHQSGRWPLLAAPLLLALYTTLLLAQLGVAWVQTGGAAGLERFIFNRADFRAVLTGGLMIREGDGALLYDEAAQHEAQRRLLAPYLDLPDAVTLPNSHPPYESFFAAAFGNLPPAAPFLAWTLLELASLAGALWLLARAAPLQAHARVLCILGALAYQPLHALLLMGQSSTLALLGLCGIYAATKAGRTGWAGVALALLLIKPQLAVPTMLLLILARHWRPILIAGVIQGALAVAAMPLLGIAWPVRYLRFLANSRGWDHNMSEYPPLMHNWRALTIHTIEPLAPWLAGPVAAALSALTIGAIVWAWRRSHGATPIPDALWALVSIGTLLIAHHLYSHDLTLLIFPAWLIVAGATAGNWSHPRAWLALVFVGSLLPSVTAILAWKQWQVGVPSIALIALAAAGLCLQLRHQFPPTRAPR